MKQTGAVNSPLPLIVQLLTPLGNFDAGQFDALREAQVKENATLEELIIRKGLASENDIAAAYADYYLLPLVRDKELAANVDRDLASLLPEKLCRDHLIAPLAVRDGYLEIAFFTPHELLLVEELHLLTGYEIRPNFATLSTVETVLGALFEETSWSAADGVGGTADFEEVHDGTNDDDADDGSKEAVVHLDQPPPPGRDGRVIRFVNQIFERALKVGASDIHIEPFEGRCRVRLRVDGQLTEITPPPLSMLTAIISRLKVLAKMDIAEKRLPQDGAIGLRSGDRRIDMRVNTCPTAHGEKIVLRVLDKDAIPLDLEGLGLDQRQASDLVRSIQMPHGLMLVTGPTGSGKSTTLYACLNRLNRPQTNICTVEDPVEYKFMGINQVQTKAQVGLTFANALRSFLRQDPDVIMVGEVRDAETAQICLRAALTGHFVLSTLHTNDALAAIDRLEDMQVEPFLLASTLRVLLAQRLIRRLCRQCREPYELDEETASRCGLDQGLTIYRPRGCSECRDRGYQGRVGVFEVIPINNTLAEMIQRRASLAELRQAVVADGMKLLKHSALEQVTAGTTSLEEALTVAVQDT